jgi:hypothetical protein
MENPPALASPMQVLEAKGKETSVDVPVEAVASVIASGANSIQRNNQGCPQGSSSVSPPSPSFNLPPTERAQLRHRSLAAELIQAESGTSPLISPARHSQEPGTAISMSAPLLLGGITVTPLYRFWQVITQRMSSALATNFKDLEKHVLPQSGRLVKKQLGSRLPDCDRRQILWN